jgi:hypothetical protein
MSADPRLELAGEALVEALRPLIAALVRDELERRDTGRRVEWLTVEEAAEQRRTTPGAMRARCERGQVHGAVKDGRRWLIPSIEAELEPDTLGGDNKRGERRANGPAPGTGGQSSHA